MSFLQKVGLFFQVLLRSLSKALSQVVSEMGAYEKIDLTKGVFLRIPKAELFLTSVGGVDLMLSNRQVSRSMRQSRYFNRSSVRAISARSWRFKFAGCLVRRMLVS